jgi:hypothetical protein
MVLSRAFTVDGVPRMLPFVDLLNHHPSAGEITITTEDIRTPGVSTKKPNADMTHYQEVGGDSNRQRLNRHPRRSLSTAVERVQQRQQQIGTARHKGEAVDEGRDTSDVADVGSNSEGNETQTSAGIGSRAVRAWSKRALIPNDSDDRSNIGRLEDGAEVAWAYKSSEASNFDLLYLYGFVSAHPAHAFFPLRMEWAASSQQEAQRAHALFTKAAVEKTTSPSVEIRSSMATPSLALTLRFRADGRSKSNLPQ